MTHDSYECLSEECQLVAPDETIETWYDDQKEMFVIEGPSLEDVEDFAAHVKRTVEDCRELEFLFPRDDAAEPVASPG